MKAILMNELAGYIFRNNPDLLFSLQAEGGMQAYLENKVDALGEMPMSLLDETYPIYLIRERCMAELTADLLPSRYNYLLDIVETEFSEEAEMMRESGVLVYEVVNLVRKCAGLLVDDFENDRMLHYAIVGIVQEYREESWHSLSGKN